MTTSFNTCLYEEHDYILQHIFIWRAWLHPSTHVYMKSMTTSFNTCLYEEHDYILQHMFIWRAWLHPSTHVYMKSMTTYFNTFFLYERKFHKNWSSKLFRYTLLYMKYIGKNRRWPTIMSSYQSSIGKYLWDILEIQPYL
jgi:hypothetical protein